MQIVEMLHSSCNRAFNLILENRQLHDQNTLLQLRYFMIFNVFSKKLCCFYAFYIFFTKFMNFMQAGSPVVSFISKWSTKKQTFNSIIYRALPTESMAQL